MRTLHENQWRRAAHLRLIDRYERRKDNSFGYAASAPAQTFTDGGVSYSSVVKAHRRGMASVTRRKREVNDREPEDAALEDEEVICALENDVNALTKDRNASRRHIQTLTLDLQDKTYELRAQKAKFTMLSNRVAEMDRAIGRLALAPAPEQNSGECHFAPITALAASPLPHTPLDPRVQTREPSPERSVSSREGSVSERPTTPEPPSGTFRLRPATWT